MNINEVFEQLNQLGEQETIEAKTAERIGKSILETVCAYANEPDLGGGYILLGVRENDDFDGLPYEVIGVDNPEQLLEDLVSQCRTRFNKPVQVDTCQMLIDDKVVIGIHIPEVHHGTKPIYFKKQGLPSGAFRRMGTSDVRCSEDDLILLYHNRRDESYDMRPLPDADWDDIEKDSIATYRQRYKNIYGETEALNWSDEKLLQSIGCIREVKGKKCLSLIGVLLFGSRHAHRRLLPNVKIEYIRVPGTQWMSDPENRYSSAIEIRGPLMTSILRAQDTVIEDIPRAFFLPEGSMTREDIPALPFKVIREAIVNAVMHRDYRVPQAIQIIRYVNRIEVRNPGYSLVDIDELGEPGSKSRNLILSEILHDTNFAEKKGTGIGLMRKLMEEAGLSPPLFQSYRRRDLFVATFLFHHFLIEEDLEWLASFKSLELSDDQAKALVFVREVGAINNSAYRNLNHVETLKASAALRQLKKLGLLEAREQGVATYYVPGELFVDSLAKRHQVTEQKQVLDGKTHQVDGKTHQVEGKTHQLEGKTHQTDKNEVDFQFLPGELQDLLEKLSRKASESEVKKAIIALCNYRSMTSAELASYLRRQDKKHLVRKFLTPMIQENLLEYKYPQMPGHPEQAYRVQK